MKRTSISLAALSLFLTATAAHAAAPVPPANRFSSSLTEPTPATGSDFHITKTSSVSVSVSAGNTTFQLKLLGVTDGVGGPLVTQTGNTFQVDLRYGGVIHTESFNFDRAAGKTNNLSTKFTIADGSLGGAGVSFGQPIQVVGVRCLQGGAGPGAPNNFCTPGVTAK